MVWSLRNCLAWVCLVDGRGSKLYVTVLRVMTASTWYDHTVTSSPLLEDPDRRPDLVATGHSR